MIHLRIDEGKPDLSSLAKRFGASNLNKAAVRAINKGVSKGNTEYKREISKYYNIKQKYIKNDIVIRKSTESKIEGTISGNRKPISLSRFNPTFVKGGQVHSIKMIKGGLERRTKKAGKKEQEKIGVSFEVIKGKKNTLPFAFMVKSYENKGVEKQIFARGKYQGSKFVRQKSRYPLAAIKTVSPLGSMKKDKISKAVAKGTEHTLNKEFERQIQLLMKK